MTALHREHIVMKLMRWGGGLLAAACCLAAAAESLVYEHSTVVPPPPVREFRGAWVATVNNTVWPSRKGLSTAEQQIELIAILDRAVQLRLNAIIFQVRPACDAFYASRFEPWSEYLTGTMGKPPQPFYDPLAFGIEAAHRRGLELHAWFNPYRALHPSAQSPIASNHVSRARPELVRKYGSYLWLDPGEKDVPEYSLSVVLDVVRRYDVDGVQFDDYFYPDAAQNGPVKNLPFPDDWSWKRFGAGGILNRDDWRRENVNRFIERTYQTIKAAKPWVKFGVSPFGIWRPGVPSSIDAHALDAYGKRYADSRKWLRNGWLDYFAPQLYWPIEPPEHSFPVLLKWWKEQNARDRHLWPGLYSAQAGIRWPPTEIVNQIRTTRRQPGATGHIHYSMKSLLSDSALAKLLEKEVYTQPALVPASPWLSTNVPGRPSIFISGLKSGNLRLGCGPADESQVWLWVIQTRSAGEWKTEIVPGRTITRVLGDFHPDVIAVTLVDRFGNASRPVVFKKTK